MLKELSANRSFGGWQKRFRHESSVLGCEMHLAVYLPPQYQETEDLPVLYWLSGLTCTDENFTTKAGAQRVAAELGMILVMPDTSPRGEDVADDDGYDLGQGAGFYLNAIQSPWSRHYRMYDYIVDELPSLIRMYISRGKAAISGHSMGGHGALTIGLKNPGNYTSVSAFAPIVNPCRCPWGQKAFSAYLGEDKELWKQYDACELMNQRQPTSLPILIDQGLGDNFYEEQLLTKPFELCCREHSYPARVRYHDDYDHSYYFMASFIEEHLRFHHKYLTE